MMSRVTVIVAAPLTMALLMIVALTVRKYSSSSEWHSTSMSLATTSTVPSSSLSSSSSSSSTISSSMSSMIPSTGISGSSSSSATISKPSSSSSVSSSTASTEEVSCECPSYISEAQCSVLGDSVLGGLDFVQYFTDFKNADGTYNESEIGLQGSAEYSTTYNGYQFHFLSAENKALFDVNPPAYLPQWGGFCSWGMAGEYCPQYPWAADCLGPSGNWGHWTIQQNRLFFFLFDEAKSKFMADPDTYIQQGDLRWGQWFTPQDSYFSTKCYVATVSD